MKRLLSILCLLIVTLVCAVAASSQVSTQNARRLRSGAADPNSPALPCVVGPPYTDKYLRTSDHSEWTCTGASTWTKVVNGGTAPSGSGTSGQVALWNGTTSLTGDSDLTFGTDTLTFTKGIVGTSLVAPLIGPSADSTTAHKVTKADLSTVVGVWDTTNSRLRVGSGVAPTTTLDVTGAGTFSGTVTSSVSSGNAFSGTTSADNQYAAQLISTAATSGQSYGALIQAGTTSGDYALRVFDKTSTNGYLQVRGDGHIFMSSVTSTGSATAADACFTGSGATQELVTDSALCIVSARRFKNSIVSDHAGLDFISKLRPVSYFLNDAPERGKQYGFVAEEVEAIDRDFVTYQKDGQIRSVLYINIISRLTEAIQEQQKQIAQLRKDLNERTITPARRPVRHHHRTRAGKTR